MLLLVGFGLRVATTHDLLRRAKLTLKLKPKLTLHVENQPESTVRGKQLDNAPWQSAALLFSFLSFPKRPYDVQLAEYTMNKMKPSLSHCLTLGYFLMFFYCGCTSAKCLERDCHPHTWDKLILVHHWPVTVCKMNMNDCDDPPQFWTIHGLWPDKGEDCNRTWHFNVNEIEDLLPDMKQYWPDILHSSLNSTRFWKHEWQKHGTCAAAIEPLNSQKKYFGKALDLYHKVDLNSYLLKVGIKPGHTHYQMSAIKEALTSFYGVTQKIQCIPPEEDEDVQTIGQIEFCFTKELELRNCTHSKTNSFLMQNNLKFRHEELSICNDTLTSYPLEV